MDNQASSPEWMDMRALTQYAAASERTFRNWINFPLDPLPAVRVGGKVLVNRRAFDSWLARHTLKPAGALDLDGIVKGVLEGVSNGR
jgi:hypothetical protein